MVRINREAPIQIAIVEFLRATLPPECIIHHCVNEGNRGGLKGIIDGQRKKKMGQVAGFPDLVVLPYATTGPAIFLEVKAPGNYADKNQKAMHERMRAMGYRVAVVRSIDDVREAFAEWGVYLKEV